MSHKFRTPLKIKTPGPSRWAAVFRVDTETEIWFLDLRNALPNFFYPVFCRLVNDTPIANYEIPSKIESLKEDQRLVKGWGDKFYWSGESRTFVVQLLHTYEYADRSENEQIFLSGESFVVSKTLLKQNILFLPNSDFKEVFPEMHPDRSRPG